LCLKLKINQAVFKITIYTDGSSLGNPGPGGYGTVLISGKHRKEISEGFRLTTNNRMELLSVILGLEALKQEGQTVEIFSDSKYVVDAVQKKWVFNWEKTGFKNKKNSDLWKRFLIIYKNHKVTLNWIKGHSQIKENERCDLLATEAAKNKNLNIDYFYEATLNENNLL
jgi:ribonuclease HI